MRGTGIEDALRQVAEIVADVRERGDAALLDWAERLDGERPKSLRVSPESIAGAELDEGALKAVRRLAAAVAEFHAPQRPRDIAVEAFKGVRAERRFLPLDSVGIYVPGGRAPLASSLVMAAVPAKVAGVRRSPVATPRPAEAVPANARELGLAEI